MLTWEDDVEVHALRKRGWTISAIARHTGRDRKTIRGYLNGTSTPGVRKRPVVDAFEVFVAYVTARLLDDPHLWVRTLCDELEDLGYAMSYQTLTRQVRDRKLRPVCQACLTATESHHQHGGQRAQLRDRAQRRARTGNVCSAELGQQDVQREGQQHRERDRGHDGRQDRHTQQEPGLQDQLTPLQGPAERGLRRQRTHPGKPTHVA